MEETLQREREAAAGARADAPSDATSPRAYIALSIAAALATIALKLLAARLTGSVGLFSDAVETGVNLFAAIVGFWALTYAARPPDAEHAFGHSKAEYFSSGVESTLILIAAAGIAAAAIPRLLAPQPIDSVGIGIAITAVAAAINGVVALVLLRAGKRLRSITLTTDAHHLFTDVWTSVGVIAGVALVRWTGWLLLDPLIALLVAASIVRTGLRLLHETANGLLDATLPAEDQEVIAGVLRSFADSDVTFHALRTRAAGRRRFVSLHVLVPGEWSVTRGHELCERLEQRIRGELERTTVFTHLEPREEPVSWNDESLDRS